MDLSQLKPIPTPESEALAAAKAAAKAYLKDTDWYVTRYVETGEATPEDVRLRRAQARETASRTATR